MNELMTTAKEECPEITVESVATAKQMFEDANREYCRNFIETMSSGQVKNFDFKKDALIMRKSMYRRMMDNGIAFRPSMKIRLFDDERFNKYIGDSDFLVMRVDDHLVTAMWNRMQ